MTSRLAICTIAVLYTSCSTLLAAEPVRIVSEKLVSNPRQPQAAVDESGTIYITFGAAGVIYCCKSTDTGKSYESPIKVGEVPRLALGMRRGPRIVVSKEAIVITAISHDTGNLLAWRSLDGGQTWLGAKEVNDSTSSAREGLHSMAMGPEGLIFCVWLDLRNKGTQIYGASSSDGGETWSENRKVYQSPSGTVCECCHPSVVIEGKGTIYVMWRNELEGNRDMFAVASKDGGQTFKTAVKLGVGNWKLDGCPMDGGHFAVISPGKLVAVWRREDQLFKLTTGDRSETLLATGEQPWIATNTDGVWLTWITKRGGELWLSTPKSKQPLKLYNNATDPVLASSSTGKGPVVAVWETGRNRTTSILAKVLEP